MADDLKNKLDSKLKAEKKDRLWFVNNCLEFTDYNYLTKQLNKFSKISEEVRTAINKYLES